MLRAEEGKRRKLYRNNAWNEGQTKSDRGKQTQTEQRKIGKSIERNFSNGNLLY